MDKITMNQMMLSYTINKPKVLAIDDRPENLLVLEKLLKPLNLELHKAHSGNEGMAKTLEHDFMLILLDVQMPEMDGYEVAEMLSWNEKTKGIPIIFLTANYADEKHELKGYQFGAVDYLFKPINKEILLGKVKVFLDLYEQRSQLQNLQNTYQSILDSAADGILGLNTEGKIVFANPAVSKILNRPADTLQELSFAELMPPKTPGKDFQDWENTEIYTRCIQNKMHKENDGVLLKSDLTPIPIQLTATPLNDPNNNLLGVVIVFSDITLQKTMEDQLKRLALYDHLTQLPNRFFFEQNISQSLARAERHSRMIAIMFLDLDHFKEINDTLGHDAGDALLKEVATRIKKCLRENDTIARLGGDEFAIILDEIEKPEDAATIAEKIIEKLNPAFYFNGNEIYARTSIGIAIYPFGGETAKILIKNADTAMYRAKQEGRGKYCFFTIGLNKKHIQKLNLAHSLRHAIEKNELFIRYQPILNLKTNAISRIEALLGWEHPHLGLIKPIEFFPIANEIGFTQKLHEWMLEHSLNTFKNWNNILDSKIKLSINISGTLLTKKTAFTVLKQAIDKTGVSANRLEIELTEATTMNQGAESEQELNAINELGIKISVDDFGTGFSSLKSLKNLPISTIKIDESLLHNIELEQDVIIKAGIALAHTLNLNVIAEGVETEQQLEFLKSIGCDEIQGYLFCHPLSSEELEKFIEQRSLV
jgi:diguanylate cyclase (GGDEF)-like protein/PAS domain S-box-containing protein